MKCQLICIALAVSRSSGLTLSPGFLITDSHWWAWFRAKGQFKRTIQFRQSKISGLILHQPSRNLSFPSRLQFSWLRHLVEKKKERKKGTYTQTSFSQKQELEFSNLCSWNRLSFLSKRVCLNKLATFQNIAKMKNHLPCFSVGRFICGPLSCDSSLWRTDWWWS